jgi:hypothetical protein
MIKVAIIPDVHGTHHWEQIIPRKDEFNKIIFLGDLVDNWKNIWPDQIKNLYRIIRFKRDNPDKVDLLWGNHDTSYYLDEHCSGFQPEREFDIWQAFDTNKKFFEVIAIYNNWIFSHAGISQVWMKFCGIKSPQEINQLFREKSNFFRWVGPDGYGNNKSEGPLWIRPEALLKTAIKDYNQIVGHTEFRISPQPFETHNKDKIICIDSPDHNFIYEIEI